MIRWKLTEIYMRHSRDECALSSAPLLELTSALMEGARSGARAATASLRKLERALSRPHEVAESGVIPDREEIALLVQGDHAHVHRAVALGNGRSQQGDSLGGLAAQRRLMRAPLEWLAKRVRERPPGEALIDPSGRGGIAASNRYRAEPAKRV